MNIKVFKSLLEDTQMNIEEATGGKTCIEMVKDKKYDLIFLDHMMPDLDGVETMTLIQKLGLCEDTPIIMLTANAIVGDREKYISFGFDEFLSKPILPEKLEKIILEFLPEDLVIKQEAVCIKSDEKNVIEEGQTLPPLDEFDFEYAKRLFPKEELLRKTLEEFYISMNPLKEKLENAFLEIEREEKLLTYRIEVHALKSTSATVGALLLSKLARLLEVSATEKDINRISVLHPILMDEIEKHRQRIETVMPNKNKGEVMEIVQTDILETLRESLAIATIEELKA